MKVYINVFNNETQIEDISAEIENPLDYVTEIAKAKGFVIGYFDFHESYNDNSVYCIATIHNA